MYSRHVREHEEPCVHPSRIPTEFPQITLAKSQIQCAVGKAVTQGGRNFSSINYHALNPTHSNNSKKQQKYCNNDSSTTHNDSNNTTSSNSNNCLTCAGFTLTIDEFEPLS